MNAIERIQAAITLLEALKADGTPGPWTTTWGSATLPAVDDLGSDDADLIAALHRTIDAQLAILRGELNFIRDESGPLFEFEPGTNVLALADAILGGES